MIAPTVVNEFAKMRHLRVGLIGSTMVLAVVGLSMLSSITSPSFDPGLAGAWYALLAGLSLGIPLVSPLLLAVLASRLADIEHLGNGWLLQATSGVTPGALCRSKFFALAVVVTAATVGEVLLVLAAGRLLAGITVPIDISHWFGFAACMMLVNLVLVAVQLLLSAKVENQLISLGVAILGTLLAVFSKGFPTVVAHLTPWGYYSLAEAADYQGSQAVSLPLSYPSIIALAVVVGLLFTLITGRFDRQEV